MTVAARPRVGIAELRKTYGGNEVLKGVTLDLVAGEVHALLGANGAGKSTLLGCLSGATRPDSGVIRLGERGYRGFTPQEAFDAGIAIIYQHFQLIGTLTVADNVFLGSELRTALGTIDKKRQIRQTAEVLGRLGVDLDPCARVETLSVGHQQMVEIARSIRRKPEVLILDEPTAALGVHEVEALLTLVRNLAHQENLAVVYVTHLLAEVLDVADAATILRDGRVYWTRPRAGLTLDQLVDGISPAVGTAAATSAETTAERGPLVLKAKQFHTGRTGPVDLEVRAGEVVGVFGLMGSGRTDVLETLAGVRRGDASSMDIDGVTVQCRSPRQAARSGIALVPADRKTQALFGDMTAIDNILMPHYARMSRPWRRRRKEAAAFDLTAQGVSLTPRNAALSADHFSGGNAQKLSVGRWASGLSTVRCLLLDEPTQGVDIGARHELYALIRTFARDHDAGVVFASSDPEEILALADEVIVLVEGRVAHRGAVTELDEFRLTALAQPQSTKKAG